MDSWPGRDPGHAPSAGGWLLRCRRRSFRLRDLLAIGRARWCSRPDRSARRCTCRVAATQLVRSARSRTNRFSLATVDGPHLRISLANIEGRGVWAPKPIRQNTRNVTDRDTSSYSSSYPTRSHAFRNINRTNVSIDVDGRPYNGEKNGRNGSNRPGSSNTRSTNSRSAGITNATGGNNKSPLITISVMRSGSVSGPGAADPACLLIGHPDRCSQHGADARAFDPPAWCCGVVVVAPHRVGLLICRPD